MVLLKALRGMTRVATMACYLAIGCLVAFFPLIHAAKAVIYPYFRWSPLVEHMVIEDSLPYFFLLAMVGACMQLVGSFVSRKISRKELAAAE